MFDMLRHRMTVSYRLYSSLPDFRIITTTASSKRSFYRGYQWRSSLSLASAVYNNSKSRFDRPFHKSLPLLLPLNYSSVHDQSFATITTAPNNGDGNSGSSGDKETSASKANDQSKRLEFEARQFKARSFRPLSPYLSIYQPQLTWLMSIGHRVTGAWLSTVMYAFALGYVLVEDKENFVPGLSQWIREHISPTSLILFKAMLSGPFFYHTFNGIRHLIWDVGKTLSLKGVYTGGWTVNGLTALGTIYYSVLV